MNWFLEHLKVIKVLSPYMHIAILTVGTLIMLMPLVVGYDAPQTMGQLYQLRTQYFNYILLTCLLSLTTLIGHTVKYAVEKHKQKILRSKELKNKKDLLAKLEELYNKEDVRNGFPSQPACISWSNTVAPLLEFNPQYYGNFLRNAHVINLSISGGLAESTFRVMVSQLEMAIQELKTDIEKLRA